MRRRRTMTRMIMMMLMMILFLLRLSVLDMLNCAKQYTCKNVKYICIIYI